MSITRIGSAKHATTPTVPTHAIGDLILGWAFRDGSTTPPSLPSGYRNIATVAGTSCSARLFCKEATATNDTMGAATNATETQCVVYRSSTGFCVPGYVATNAGTTNTLNYAALAAMADASGRSWVCGGVGHRSIDQGIESPPTGMSLIDNLLDATAESALHDTNGAVSSWSSQNVTLSGTASGWCSFALEIVEAGAGSGDIAHVQHYSFSTDAGGTAQIVANISAVGNGNAIVGAFGWSGPGHGPGTVSDNQGNTYTVVNTGIDTADEYLNLFYKVGITNAPTVVTVQLSGSNVSWRMLALDEFTNVDSVEWTDGQAEAAPGTGRDALNTTAQTTTAADDLLWTVASNVWDGTRPDPGSGFLKLGGTTAAGGLSIDTASRIERGTRSVEGLWTALSNVNHIAALIGLKKASSGGIEAGAGSAAATTSATGAGEAIKSAAGSAGSSTSGVAGGAANVAGVGSSSANTSATAVGARIAEATGLASATSSASAAGSSFASTAGSAAAAVAATASGSATASSDGTAAGTSSAAAVGRSTASSAGSSAAVTTAAGSSSTGSIASGAGSASAATAANGVGSATAASVGASAAVATASGAGRATTSSAGLAAANSNVAGVGRSTVSSAGASAVSTTALGVSSSAQGSAGSASAVSSAAAGGSSIGSAAGSAAVGVTITGAGVSIVSRSGSAAAISTAAAGGRSIVAAAANANATSDALGVGRVVATGTGSAAATTAALARSTFNLSTQPAALIV